MLFVVRNVLDGGIEGAPGISEETIAIPAYLPVCIGVERVPERSKLLLPLTDLKSLHESRKTA